VSKFLKSVYVKEDTIHIPKFEPDNMQITTKPKITITEDEMYKKLAGLTGNKN